MADFRQDLRTRFAALGVVIVLVLGSLLVRLWSMQIISGQSYAKQSENNRVRVVNIVAPRGRILDAKGRVLVGNRPALAVAVSPERARDDAMLARLATLLSVPVKDIQKRMASTKLSALQPRVVAVDVRQAAVDYLSEHADQFPGVEVQVLPIREYPYKGLGAHVLGYVGEISDDDIEKSGKTDYTPGDIVGKGGVERQYETVLQGEKGFQRLEVDARGRVHRVLDRREPVPGRDIRLSVDIDVQRVAEKALENAFAEARNQKFYKANAGAIVVMDVDSGAVVALASAPTYEPAKFVSGISQKDWKSLNATESAYPLNDRAVMSQYPPASTYKIVTGLAALKEGFATQDSGFECQGTWWFPGHEDSPAKWWQKKCWKADGHGSIGFMSGVEESCDSVFYTLGYKFYELPDERLQAYSRSAGLGKKTGIDLPGESAGRVPDAAWKRSLNGTIAPEYAQWVPGDTVNMAIGQGDLLVTPVQLAQLTAAIANDGKLVKPHVLDQVMERGGKQPALQANTVVTGKLPSSSGQIDIMQRALLGVTEDGTARGAFASFPIPVAGKTGTAQVGSPNLPKDSPLKKDDYALFVGYAPADKPKYSVSVIVEQGGHGGSVAAPAAREVMGQLFGQPIRHISTEDASR